MLGVLSATVASGRADRYGHRIAFGQSFSGQQVLPVAVAIPCAFGLSIQVWRALV
jgi:hypothetical protein